jgi:Protein of unknown function (DUF3035)
LTLPMLAGCSGFRQMVGLDQPAPDEFAVESRAPLTIPPDFSLRPPKPGAPRPQEASAEQRAEKVIDAAGAGAPGDQASFALNPSQQGGLATQVNPQQQVAPDSLASKLLSTTDSSAGGAIANRSTEPLKGVY